MALFAACRHGAPLVEPLFPSPCEEVQAYLDEDADGYGVGEPVTVPCGLVATYALVGGDCDDWDRSVSPRAYERCSNGVDDDCDGAVDEPPDLNTALMDGRQSDCSLGVEYARHSTTVGVRWRGGYDEQMGKGVSVGDFDGDGADDILAFSDAFQPVTFEFEGTERRGGGYLLAEFSPREPGGILDGSATSTLVGGVEDGLQRAESVGDLNGDGFIDVFMGSTRNQPTYGTSGYGYILSGPVPPGVVMIEEAGRRVEGAGLNVSLTQSFSGPGDLDGDGLDDLVIGAPAFAPDAPSAAVYVMRGPADQHVLEAETVLRGDGAKGDMLGYTAAALGDVTGDGVPDFGVGASQHTSRAEFGAVGYVVSSVPTGEVYVGDVGYRVGSFNDVTDTIVWLHSAGDVNGDGHLDVLVSVAQRSALALIHGPIPETGERHVYTDHDALLYESLNYDYLESVSAADTDGDGYGELVIGESMWTRPGNACDFGKVDGCNVGAVFTVAGPLGGSVDLMMQADRIEGGQYSQRLGNFVHAGDDFDGDGLADLVIADFMSGGGVHLLFGMR
jgi:hypothetical protein